MWYDKINVEHRPHCKNAGELGDRLPVCIDDRDAKEERIQSLRERNYEVSKMDLAPKKEEKCLRCRR